MATNENHSKKNYPNLTSFSPLGNYLSKISMNNNQKNVNYNSRQTNDKLKESNIIESYKTYIEKLESDH